MSTFPDIWYKQTPTSPVVTYLPIRQIPELAVSVDPPCGEKFETKTIEKVTFGANIRETKTFYQFNSIVVLFNFYKVYRCKLSRTAKSLLPKRSHCSPNGVIVARGNTF